MHNIAENRCIVAIYFNSPLFRYDALDPKRNDSDDDKSNRIGIRREGVVDVLTAIVVGVGIVVVGHYRMECLVIVSLSLSLVAINQCTQCICILLFALSDFFGILLVSYWR